jgi:predicted RecB family nuclease
MNIRPAADRLLTPSKITAWLDCAHYLTLVDSGVKPTNVGMSSFAELLMNKGMAHERAYLDLLAASGKEVFEVPAKEDGESFAAWTDRVAGALAEGHDVVYQMPFVHDGMRGVADFLVKVDTPSALGGFSYEPVDAKLARAQAKPGHVLQLCFYADALEAAQGVRPKRVYLYLGSGELESVSVADVGAYWRRIRRQLRRVMNAEHDDATSSEPCSHCGFCEFAEVCDAQWRAADALYYVAGIRQTDIAGMVPAGITTMTALAAGPIGVLDVKPERLDVIHRQAAIQVRAVEGEPPPFDTIAAASGADADALRRRQLPQPDNGDVFLDYEGHPFWTAARGLFFLFGLLHRDADGDWQYETRWAHDVAGEADNTRALISWIAERRALFPGMHVYHYNHTERSSLERLASEHGADEGLLAELVANGVFVDVLDVIRQTVRVGAESYSLKVLELVAGYERGHDIDQGAGAVVEYEAWCSDPHQERLDRIARYNDDDVRATLAVRDWLLSEPLNGEPFREPVVLVEEEDDTDEVVAALIATGEEWKVLLAHLLSYWSREGRAHRGQRLPALEADEADRLANPSVITGLELVEICPPEGKQRAGRAVFRFPAQELSPEVQSGKHAVFMYPIGDDGVVSFSADRIDVDARELVVAWADKLADAPIPAAVVVNDWVSPRPKPAALKDYARRVLDGTELVSDAVRATLLRRELPRFNAGAGPTDGTFTAELDEIVRVAPHLNRSYLAVQGPPGTGKTYTGSRVIGELLERGRKVGVTAFSHAAIDNLVREVLKVRPSVRVLRQGATPEDPAKRIAGATYDGNGDKWKKGSYDLLAGTSWMFSNDKATDVLDVLVIDEAGQMGLADALAAMGSARNVILLGDPLQLAQVSLATHPGGAGASTLEHVLGEHATIPDDRGVFLDETWRMHPDVCSFLSTQIYDDRLHAHKNCGQQSVGGEAGLRWIRADHDGCDTSSADEAELVANTLRSLLGQAWMDFHGNERPITGADVIVVAPYNDHVNLIRDVLDGDPTTRAARVGTVDKFQGQEAPVVIFTMATSNGACMPRTADFLYSRNRLNVAISRARALAYVICTEDLLDTRAGSVEEMRLIGTLCAFVEAASTESSDRAR